LFRRWYPGGKQKVSSTQQQDDGDGKLETKKELVPTLYKIV